MQVCWPFQEGNDHNNQGNNHCMLLGWIYFLFPVDLSSKEYKHRP